MNANADYDELVRFTTMTPEEIVEVFLTETDMSTNQLCENDFSDEDFPCGFKVEIVDEEGGYEGGGEHAERVFKVENPSLDGFVPFYFRITGFYQSYNGTDWNDDATIVVPREVVVTQYFPVGQ